MVQLDNKKIGLFIAALRKEQQMTQQDLAGKVGVSNKAVSKWERGLSLPDVALLPSLAEVLGVTVTELLTGERIATEEPLPLQEVEQLVNRTLSIQAEQGKDPHRGPWLQVWLLGLVMGAVILLVGSAATGQVFPQILYNSNSANLIVSVLLGGAFGLCDCFLPARLPSYYDENKIYGYYGKGMRLHLPIAINNRNWTAIRRAMLYSSLVMMTLLPVLWFVTEAIIPPSFVVAKQVGGTAVVLLVFFIPMLLAGVQADKNRDQ